VLAAIYDLIREASSCDGICPAVLEDIAANTGRTDTILVHSGFEPRHLAALEAMPETRAEDVIRIAYVGTIISESSFLAVLAALQKVRAALPRPVVLEFFGARGYRARPWFNPQWMAEHGVFSDEELVTSLQRCSWGIVVMDLEAQDLRYSWFSFPNKIGTYLSAGVPVLGFGHEQSSLARIMRDHRMGMFTSAVDPGALQRLLAESLQVPDPRSVFREDILRCAHAEFNAQEIRRQLWNAWGVSKQRIGG
jgi:hypothetical protein